MTKYEYLTLVFEANRPLHPGHLDHDAFNLEINNRGAEGWELVNTFTTNQSSGVTHAVIAVMKRPLPSAAE